MIDWDDDYVPPAPECAKCGREGHDADGCPSLDEGPFIPTTTEDEPW